MCIYIYNIYVIKMFTLLVKRKDLTIKVKDSS